jgi:OOP family OmpA-OmpF porin
MKNIKLAVLLLAAAGLAAPACAELKDKNELTVQAGAMIFEGDAHLDNGFIYGARLGHYFTERLSAELAVFPGNTEAERGGADVATLHPSVGALYHFRFGKFMPFVQAGAGLLRLKADGASASSDLAVHWGGGLKYFYRPELLLRADVTHVIDTEIGKGTHDLEAVLGVSWLFGTSGKEAAKAVQEVKQIIDPDSDGDGIADSKDACAATPSGTAVDEKGCPLAKPDSDGDKVEDAKDECPGTPAGTAVDEKGCPQGTKAIPADNWVLKGVTFEVNSDVLKAESKATLDEAAATLQPRTSVRLEVQGHTDNTGNAAANQALSEKRAAAVKAYLVDKGIAADRLETKGYGDTAPVADNATAAGRDANRRIEFKVLSR